MELHLGHTLYLCSVLKTFIEGEILEPCHEHKNGLKSARIDLFVFMVYRNLRN